MKTVKGILGMLSSGSIIPMCSDRRLDSEGNLEIVRSEPVRHGAPRDCISLGEHTVWQGRCRTFTDRYRLGHFSVT